MFKYVLDKDEQSLMEVDSDSKYVQPTRYGWILAIAIKSLLTDD